MMTNMINKLCLICQTNKRVGINMFKDFSLWKTTTKIETYSSSPVLRGLLAQVYLWAFLGMRHTYWNLFSALLVLNFLLILSLWLGCRGVPLIFRKAAPKLGEEIRQGRGAS